MKIVTLDVPTPAESMPLLSFSGITGRARMGRDYEPKHRPLHSSIRSDTLGS